MIFKFLFNALFVFLLIVIILLLFILVIPIYITITYENLMIKLFIYKYLIYQIKIDNISNFFTNQNKKTNQEISFDNNYSNFFKRIKIKKIIIKCGYQIEDWYLNSYLFVFFYSVFGMLDSYFYTKNIDFNYEIQNKKIGIEMIKIRIKLINYLIFKDILKIGIKKIKKEKIKIGMKYIKE